MGDPRVEERDNPLVRRLNAVAQENERLGTALGGGGRPARAPQGPVVGGTATVLPPPAVPLSDEDALADTLPPAELEEMERRWSLDPSNPANRPAIVQGQPMPEALAPTYNPRALQAVPAQTDYVSIITSLPITDEEKQQVRMWVFAGAAKAIMLETAKRLDAMQAAFGLAPEVQDAVQGSSKASGVDAEVASTEPVNNSSVPAKPRKRRVQAKTPRSTGA